MQVKDLLERLQEVDPELYLYLKVNVPDCKIFSQITHMASIEQTEFGVLFGGSYSGAQPPQQSAKAEPNQCWKRLQQDEWYCPRCDLRWPKDEEKPSTALCV